MKTTTLFGLIVVAFATPVLAADEVGVPVCDSYLKNYETCVSTKMPKQALEQYKASLQQTRDSWKSLAANPTTKPSLQQACEQATAAAKQAMGAMGCTF